MQKARGEGEVESIIKADSLVVRAVNGGTLSLDDLFPHSIALDGAVQGPVMGDEKDRWSFDHHAGCARLITEATCQQVFAALCLGLATENRQVYINDIDGDTLVSLWLLAHPNSVTLATVRNLVRAVGVIDAHGPAGNRLLNSEEQDIAAAFFNRLRDVLPRDVQAKFDSWQLFVEKGFDAIEDTISDIRDDALPRADGKPPEIEMIAHGDRQGVKACIARSDGFGAFAPLYDAGHRVVVLVADAADGSFRYTVGKVSDLVAYPLGPGNAPDSLLGRLNAREPGWGGGSSIGGSPRLEGGVSSRLTPEQIWEMMA